MTKLATSHGKFHAALICLGLRTRGGLGDLVRGVTAARLWRSLRIRDRGGRRSAEAAGDVES